MGETIYDVAVIGAGPAGAQAAVSASHQMRHVLVLHSGKVSFSRGRAYWSKSVEIEDAPVFPGIIGPHFAKELMKMDGESTRCRFHARFGETQDRY